MAKKKPTRCEMPQHTGKAGAVELLKGAIAEINSPHLAAAQLAQAKALTAIGLLLLDLCGSAGLIVDTGPIEVELPASGGL